MKKIKKEETNNTRNTIRIIELIIFILILIITIYLAYIGVLEKLVLKMGNYGILGIFLTGIFWGYSFASVPATALLIYFVKLYPPWIIALIGAMGVVFENTLVFLFFQKELPEEIKKKVDKIIYEKLKMKGKNWLIILAALIVMTTPIPNEIGIYLLTIAKFNEKAFMLLSFITSFCGILIISSIGTLI